MTGGVGAVAGDWIKMRTDLACDPAVIALAETLNLDEDTIVGKLHRFWSWASEQLRSGNAPGVTPSYLNRVTGATGFAEALVKVGWLVVTDHGVRIPKFEVHNSETAKQRALTRSRVAAFRLRNGNGNGNASCVTPSISPLSSEKQHSRKGPTKKRGPVRRKLSDEEFVQALRDNPAYAHFSVNHELSRMDAWLLTHPKRQKTRTFIVNWLNRIDAPLLAGNGKTQAPSDKCGRCGRLKSGPPMWWCQAKKSHAVPYVEAE